MHGQYPFAYFSAGYTCELNTIGHKFLYVQNLISSKYLSFADLQSQGVLISVGGLGMLVSSDFLTDKNYPALNKGKGDAFMIVGATLYGFSESLLALMTRLNCVLSNS